MSSPKPCLGYRSRTDAVVALRQQGMTTAEISARTGISPKDVGALEASAIRSGKHRPEEPRPTTGVMFPPWLLDALKPHAEKRRLTPGYLAFRILEAVVKDKLVDSVLDDLGEEAAA